MKNYRNRAILEFAKDAPKCFRCGMENDPTVVACHSNAIIDGHGAGLKAHDCVAFLCSTCHAYIDQNWKQPGVQEEFYHSVYFSMVWLLQTSRIAAQGPPYLD